MEDVPEYVPVVATAVTFAPLMDVEVPEMVILPASVPLAADPGLAVIHNSAKTNPMIPNQLRVMLIAASLRDCGVLACAPLSAHFSFRSVKTIFPA